MSNQLVKLNITGMYIKGAGISFGATGSGYAVTLRMAFDAQWEGLTKTVYFRDANGQNPVSVVIGLDMAVDGDTLTYDVPVPSEPLSVVGYATLSVRGVKVNSADNTVADTAITTQAVRFRVLDADLPSSILSTIATTDKEQLQSEIDALESVFTTSKAAAETAATNAAASETAAAQSTAAAGDSAAASAASASTASEKAETAVTKAGEASASAQSAADSAREAAQIVGGNYATKVTGAVSGNLAGLNATGNLVDSGKKPQDFAAASHAANHATSGSDPLTPAQIGAATTLTLTATISTGWTASGGYYYKQMSVPGMLATDNPVADILPGSDNDANKLYVEAWGKVQSGEPMDGAVKLWATEAPITAFPLQFKITRTGKETGQGKCILGGHPPADGIGPMKLILDVTYTNITTDMEWALPKPASYYSEIMVVTRGITTPLALSFYIGPKDINARIATIDNDISHYLVKFFQIEAEDISWIMRNLYASDENTYVYTTTPDLSVARVTGTNSGYPCSGRIKVYAR
jgi:hypothetical protein